MATQTATPPKTPSVPKVKKESVTPVQRITDMLKRAAVANKISKDELETVANLAVALKTFMSA